MMTCTGHKIFQGEGLKFSVWPVDSGWVGSYVSDSSILYIYMGSSRCQNKILLYEKKRFEKQEHVHKVLYDIFIVTLPIILGNSLLFIGTLPIILGNSLLFIVTYCRELGKLYQQELQKSKQLQEEGYKLI